MRIWLQAAAGETPPGYCGEPPQGGWVTLPDGWTLGESASLSTDQPLPGAPAGPDYPTGIPAEGSPALRLLGLLILVAALAAAAWVVWRLKDWSPVGYRRRRHAERSSRDMAEGDLHAAARTEPGAAQPNGLESPGPPDRPAPLRVERGRRPSADPIRTQARGSGSKPLVVSIRRGVSSPASAPVQLPPHVAAALRKARTRTPPAGPRLVPPREASAPERSDLPAPEPEPDAEERTPPGDGGTSGGKSWLIDD